MRDLPPGLAAVFSGVEMHHEQRGRLVVGLTDRGLVDAMREHFASYGVSDVEIRIVRHTDRQLEATAQALGRRLVTSRGPRDEIHVQVSRKTLGKVTVEFVAGR